MLRLLILLLLPLAALFLQASIFSVFNIKGAVPDLLLIFIIFFALINGPKKGGVYGLLCGLLEDLYLGRFIGMNAIAKGITGYAIGNLQINVFKENLLVGVISVLIGSILNIIILLLLTVVFSTSFSVDLHFLVDVFFHLSYNFLLAIPLYMWYYNSSKSGILKNNGER